MCHYKEESTVSIITTVESQYTAIWCLSNSNKGWQESICNKCCAYCLQLSPFLLKENMFLSDIYMYWYGGDLANN